MPEPTPPIDVTLLLAQTGWVRGLARTLIDPSLAEDVSQGALLIAMSNPPRYEGEHGFRAWLATVVRNLAKATVRGDAHRREREQRAARAETSHKGMQISDSDWAVFLQHLGATFDAFELPTAERNDVLGFIESTRADIVEVHQPAEGCAPR